MAAPCALGSTSADWNRHRRRPDTALQFSHGCSQAIMAVQVSDSRVRRLAGRRLPVAAAAVRVTLTRLLTSRPANCSIALPVRLQAA